MHGLFRSAIGGLVLLSFVATSHAQTPETGAHGPSQAAADAIRQFAGTDGAFLAAGLVKSAVSGGRLESLLQFPTEELVVVSITGGQVRQAFERSVSLLPQPNSSFLQISGFEVTVDRNAGPNSRVVSVTAGGVPLDEARMYTVAMPASLGRGGLGYFKIWDRNRITKTFAGVSVESVLQGKPVTESRPRWTIRG
jgi:2',3'-cyclic-nucleotide 2'-phosphodiesterase (5'-nucleotidase family)